MATPFTALMVKQGGLRSRKRAPFFAAIRGRGGLATCWAVLWL